MKEVEAEVVPAIEEAGPWARAAHARVLGPVGVALALLTLLAASGVGFMMLFGTTVISAAAVFALWPKIFSPQFTRWVFGAEQVGFGTFFVLFLAAGAVVKLFRRRTWQRK